MFDHDRKTIKASEVLNRYGISVMTLNRWIKDPKMAFPAPMYFGRYRHFWIDEIEEWERKRVSNKEAA